MPVSVQLKRYVSAAAAVLVMVLAAESTGEMELLFPEAAALFIGAWTLPSQPWKVSRPVLVLLMGTSAILGICVVRFVPAPLYIQLALAFICIAGILFISRTSMVPAISACILPVMLGTRSWVYPLAVAVLAVLAVLGRWGMERAGWVQPVEQTRVAGKPRSEFIRWLKLLLCFLVLAVLPAVTGAVYFIVPPLIVVFIEYSNPGFRQGKSVVKVAAVLFLSALTGVAARMVLHEKLHVPLTVAAVTAITLLFCVQHVSGVRFPPAGALALLPMLLPADGLWLYPIEAGAGAIVLIAVSYLVFPARQRQKGTPKSPEYTEPAGFSTL